MARLRFILCFCMVAAWAVFGPGLGTRPVIAAEEAPPVPKQDVEVLASGPIHEAFAEAVVFNPEPGIVAPKAPPPLIEEIPPDQKPEGDVQWIPGYWAWDDGRNDFIWVSGIWRVPPPGREWVPGYWTPVSQGYQWISGYWASVNTEETEYLPEPPESVEVGPSSNAPSPDYTWIPGCWLWQHRRYAWRPGYWAVMHRNWTWVPAHYIWTPRGYVFVSGYWDYPVIDRGVLFAPVFFSPWVSLGLGFSFSPGFVINLDVFDDALFVRPRYGHYYFGDYYASRYYRMGFYPWFSLHARRLMYDPIYAHQRWTHRNDRRWENRLETRFRERREHEGLRPLRSFEHRPGPGRAGRVSGHERPEFVAPLNRAVRTKVGAFRFHPLRERERREFSRREKEVRTYERERQSRETQHRNMLEPGASRGPGPNRERFSRSPIMDRSSQRVHRRNSPPALYRAPRTNPGVEPLERRHDRSPAWGGSQRRQERGRQSEVRRGHSRENFQRSGERRERAGDRGGSSKDRRKRPDSRQETGSGGWHR